MVVVFGTGVLGIIKIILREGFVLGGFGVENTGKKTYDCVGDNHTG